MNAWVPWWNSSNNCKKLWKYKTQILTIINNNPPPKKNFLNSIIAALSWSEQEGQTQIAWGNRDWRYKDYDSILDENMERENITSIFSTPSFFIPCH